MDYFKLKKKKELHVIFFYTNYYFCCFLIVKIRPHNPQGSFTQFYIHEIPQLQNSIVMLRDLKKSSSVVMAENVQLQCSQGKRKQKVDITTYYMYLY